jgi:hypothetical protein
LLTIEKSGSTSTLDISQQVKAMLPHIAAGLPSALHITALSDQSVFVKSAIVGVAREAVIAACLTALMILLFLGSWRATLIALRLHGSRSARTETIIKTPHRRRATRAGSAETDRRALSHAYSDRRKAGRRSRLLCHPMPVGSR